MTLGTSAQVYELCERLNGARCSCRATEHTCITLEKYLDRSNGDVQLAEYLHLEDQMNKGMADE